MWFGGSEKWLLCKNKNKKLIILEYALLLHFVWSGGSEKELLCKKRRQNKLQHFNWFNKKMMKKKMKLNYFDRFKLSKNAWLCFVVVFKTLYLVLIRFCNLAAETALIPQLVENSATVSRFSRLQASNGEIDHMGISRIVPTWILS